MSDAKRPAAGIIPFDAEPPLSPEERVARPRLVRPADMPLWVFGYGSLMWDPGFPYEECCTAVVRGYHRAFCVYSHHYRGTREHPGLVLGLKRGGVCRGRAFRVADPLEESVVDYLYRREMLTGVYRPTMLTAQTDTVPISVLAFVADPKHAQFAGQLTEAQMVARIRHACGARGPCRDYLANTVRQLEAIGIADTRLRRLLRAVEQE